MDAKIKKIQRSEKKVGKELSSLLTADKKQDKKLHMMEKKGKCSGKMKKK